MLGQMYLSRLERLVELRREREQELNEQGVRLLDRSIFATYCACRSSGVCAEAVSAALGGRETEAIAEEVTA